MAWITYIYVWQRFVKYFFIISKVDLFSLNKIFLLLTRSFYILQCKWKVGQKCLALYTEDSLYYEAVILELTPSRQPNNALVQFEYYGNEQETPFSDLLPEKCKHELEQNSGSNIATTCLEDSNTNYCNGDINDVIKDDVTGTTTSETVSYTHLTLPTILLV